MSVTASVAFASRASELAKLSADQLRAWILSREFGLSVEDAARTLAEVSGPAPTAATASTTSGKESPIIPSKRRRDASAVPADRVASTEESGSATPAPSSNSRPQHGKKDKENRIDWTRTRRRRIALQVAYFGDSYAGFAYQRPDIPTVEGELCNALIRTALVPNPDHGDPFAHPVARAQVDAAAEAEAEGAVAAGAGSDEGMTVIRKPGGGADAGAGKGGKGGSGREGEVTSFLIAHCNYTRCGRTDKGVNARGQVIALDVRTVLPGLLKPWDAEKAKATAAALAAEAGAGGGGGGGRGSGGAEAKFNLRLAQQQQQQPAAMTDSASAAPAAPAADPRVKGLLPLGMRCSSVVLPTMPYERTGYQGGDADADVDVDVGGAGQGGDDVDVDGDSAEGKVGIFASSAMVDVLPSSSRTPDPAAPASAPFAIARHDSPDDVYDWSLDSADLDYVALLNRVLPEDIRVLSWAPVGLDFSARFSCDSRTYKYYLFADGMDVAAMQRAAGYFIGVHDFRNVCKMDFVNLTHFRRRVLAVDVRPVSAGDDVAAPGVGGAAETDFFMWGKAAAPAAPAASPSAFHTSASAASSAAAPLSQTQRLPRDSLLEVTVIGEAFLYHQVRCMISLILAVGRGLETPELVRDLLDLSLYPAKPNYLLASDTPLVLWDAAYGRTRWRISAAGLAKVLASLHASARKLQLQSKVFEAVMRSMIPTARQLPGGAWEGVAATCHSAALTTSSASSVSVAEGKTPLQQQHGRSNAGKELLDLAYLTPHHSLPSSATPFPVDSWVAYRDRPASVLLAHAPVSFAPTFPEDDVLLLSAGAAALQLEPAHQTKDSTSIKRDIDLNKVAAELARTCGASAPALGPSASAPAAVSASAGDGAALPASTAIAQMSPHLPYRVFLNHKPFAQRDRENSLDKKLTGMSDKDKAKRAASEDFARWIREENKKKAGLTSNASRKP